MHNHRTIRRLAALACGHLLTFAAPTAHAGGPSDAVDVMSFNVLAPCYASPSYYPARAATLLPREKRGARIVELLSGVDAGIDVIALQETTASEFARFQQALGETFWGFQAHHDDHYWRDWTRPESPWEPNGVAIFVRKSTFHDVVFQRLSLGKTGNHAALLTAIQTSTGQATRVASIHLDKASLAERETQLRDVMHAMPRRPGTRDIVAGDFNQGTQCGGVKDILTEHHFIDALHALNREEATHPYGRKDDLDVDAEDHIVTRHAVLLDGQVESFGLWETYPDDEDARVAAGLAVTGSDHFPVRVLMR